MDEHEGRIVTVINRSYRTDTVKYRFSFIPDTVSVNLAENTGSDNRNSIPDTVMCQFYLK